MTDCAPFLQAAFDEYAGRQVLTATGPLNTQIADLTGQITAARRTLALDDTAIAERDATILALNKQLADLRAQVHGPPLPAGWSKVTFFDDFTAPLDPAVWKVEDRVGHTRDQAWLTKEQVTVRDSCMVITADKMATPINGRTIASGAVSSRAMPGIWQLGGYFEARMAMPTAAALWSAFWLRNKAKGELDVAEATGPQSPIVQTAHQNTDGKLPDGTKFDKLGYEWTPPPGWRRQDFHTYGVAWDAAAGRLTWYIDGQPTKSRTPADIAYPSGKPASWLTGADYIDPMALLFDLQVGGAFSTYYGNQVVNPAQLDGTAQAQLRVDWVRVLSR